jgi:hypothetical protein
MIALGVDLGKHLALCAIDEDLRCVYEWAETRATEAEPLAHLALALEAVWNGVALDELDGGVVAAEVSWLKPIPGNERIDPRSLFALSEQLGYLTRWAELVSATMLRVDPQAASSETGIRKGQRVATMPTLLTDLRRDEFLGPRGGGALLPHLGDAEWLAYVAMTRATWQARVKEATG